MDGKSSQATGDAVETCLDWTLGFWDSYNIVFRFEKGAPHSDKRICSSRRFNFSLSPWNDF